MTRRSEYNQLFISWQTNSTLSLHRPRARYNVFLRPERGSWKGALKKEGRKEGRKTGPRQCTCLSPASSGRNEVILYWRICWKRWCNAYSIEHREVLAFCQDIILVNAQNSIICDRTVIQHQQLQWLFTVELIYKHMRLDDTGLGNGGF